MAVKSTKLSGGGQTGEVVKKPSLLDGVENNPRKLVFGVTIAFFAMIFIAWGWGELTQIIGTRPEVNNVCTKDASLMNGVIENVRTTNVNGLSQNVNDARARDGYQQDQNCLAIITWYAMLTRDISTAQQNLDAIKQVYNPEAAYDDQDNLYTSNPDKIAVIFSGIKAKAEASQRDFERFNEGGAQ